MSDLISRQAAIDALNEVSEHYTNKGREWHPHINFMVDAIRDLPSAEPDGTKGVFIPDITVEMFRNASLEGVETLMAEGDMYDIVLPSAQPEQKKGEWIAVTERLPEENGFYLCLYKHKHPGGVAMDEGLSILQWINNKWGINDIYIVTHWAPLPQPPESEGKT